MTAMLETKNLGISFGGLKAVDGLSLKIEKGQLYGLIGPNGAGKTTAFNLLTGVYKPTMGNFFLDGEKMTGHNTVEINKKGIARTFQNIRLFNSQTVADNVRIALHNQRIVNPLDVLFRTPKFRRDEKLMDEKVNELLEILKISNKKYELASNLPYGEQRKLEIARALASNPKLLLLDEPAAGMNPQETEELRQMIELIRKHFHLTVLLIEHDMKFVMQICERIMVLDYGRIIAEGLPEEIKKNPDVIKAYLGSEA